MMREVYNAKLYQEHMTQWILEHRYCGIFAEMGLGKTVACLTALDQMMYVDFSATRCLVIAPLEVSENTWPDELAKWQHLSHLRLSLILGDPYERVAAINKPADIYVINVDNVSWLITHLGSRWPWDVVVLDESSLFKNHKSQRFKNLKMMRPKMQRVILLTGTPTPQSIMDLWAQLFMLDAGQRLYPKVGQFRTRYFERCFNSDTGYATYEVTPDGERAIHRLIGDICISLSQADYLQLPDIVDNTIRFKLSPETQAVYKKFKKDKVLEMYDELTSTDVQIAAFSAGALNTKMLQFNGGAVYDADHKVHVLHDEKLKQLDLVIEQMQGKPLLVFYWFKHELDRLLARYPQAVQYQGREQLLLWNKKKLPMMLAHPQSVAYGLNMQAGGHIIVWYSLTYAAGLYRQANARLFRQGQLEPVWLFRLVAKGTTDERAIMVCEGKITKEQALMEATKAILAEVLEK